MTYPKHQHPRDRNQKPLGRKSGASWWPSCPNPTAPCLRPRGALGELKTEALNLEDCRGLGCWSMKAGALLLVFELVSIALCSMQGFEMPTARITLATQCTLRRSSWFVIPFWLGKVGSHNRLLQSTTTLPDSRKHY